MPRPGPVGTTLAPKIRAASKNSGKGETVEQWFKRFHAEKEKKGLSTVSDMRGRASNWILPSIEQKPMRDGSLSFARTPSSCALNSASRALLPTSTAIASGVGSRDP
jgi:hypothetical protein